MLLSSDDVNSVSFDPKGKYIVSGSDDKTVRIWDAETGAAVGSVLTGHLREVLRKERDLLENMMRDHTQKETENTLKQERLEAAAARREKTLHERLQSAEKELDALRMSSISDSKYRTLQDQFKREKEQLQTRLDIALEDVKRSEQQRTSDARRLEQKLVSMTAEADMANSKLRSLERQAQEAEEAGSSERKEAQ